MSDASTFARLLIPLCFAHPCFAAEISESSLRAADAEQMRIIVDADAKAQSAFMHPNYIINGPSNRVVRKPVLVQMLADGKMASDRFERTIEGTAITGNIGIVMGSDWPFVPWHPSPVTWLQGLESLSQDEKDKILWQNLESLLAL